MEKKAFFRIEQSGSKINITMNSTMENIDQAASITKGFLLKNKLNDICFSTCLVLREALTNAVRHANKFDLAKRIFYSIELKKNSIEITIKDEGDGFNWEEALKKDYASSSYHGRGLKIMLSYFDKVEFNKKGTIIFLRKNF